MNNPVQIIVDHGQSHKSVISEIEKYESSVCTVTIEAGKPKKRGLSANALQAVWIKEIAEWTGKSIVDIRRYLKYELGLPIFLYDVKTQDEMIAAKQTGWILDKIGFDHQPYDKKLKMLDPLAITSIMSTRQHTEFRNQIQAHYAPDLILEIR